MADLDITDNNISPAHVQSIPRQNRTNTTLFEVTNGRNITSLKAYLTSVGYTAAQLAGMTKNDMIFALRDSQGTTQTKAVVSIALTGTQTTTVAGTTTFTATATYEDGTTGSINGLSGVAFSSSNTGVATVNATSGVVTGVAAGTSAIWVTYRGTTSAPRTVTVS